MAMVAAFKEIDSSPIGLTINLLDITPSLIKMHFSLS